MATDLENLQTIRTNLISALVTQSASPQPSYNIDGQAMSWNEYRQSLLTQIGQLDALIGAEEPFEIVTHAAFQEPYWP